MAKPSEVAALVGAEVKKYLDPLQGLLKALDAPAKRQGISPQDLLTKMCDNQQNLVIGSDGSALPMPTTRTKGLGREFGQFLGALFEYQARGNSGGPAAMKALEGFGCQRVSQDGVTKAALAESTGITGGYTVPPQFSDRLLSLAAESSIVRPRATVLPMTSLTLQVPALDLTTVQSAGRSPFFGGIVGTWTAEAATRTESEPTFRQIELKAHELALYTVASNTLLADSAVALDSLLTQLFGAAIPWYEDYAFFQGNAVGKPLGIINSAACLNVTRGTATTFKFADAATMYSKLYYLLNRGKSAAWVISPSVIPQVLQMVDAGSRVIFIPLSAGLQAALSETAGPASIGSIFGLPVIVSEKLPALGTAGDVLLCDFSQYLIGDRQQLQIDVSPHVDFLKNRMTWRVLLRVDGQPWLNSYITLQDATTTVSAFVRLGS